MDNEPKITAGLLIVGFSPVALLALYLIAWIMR